jgi:hypothetical protein
MYYRDHPASSPLILSSLNHAVSILLFCCHQFSNPVPIVTVSVSGLSEPEQVSHYMLLDIALVSNRNGRDSRTSSSTRRLRILSGQKGTPFVVAPEPVLVLTDNLL